MKRIFTTIMAGAAALVGMVSCSQYDDSALRDSLAGLTDRIDAIDSALTGVQGEVANIQELVAKAEANVTVSSLEKEDSKYTLVFSDGDTVVLTDGANGDKGDKGDKGEAGENGDAGKDGMGITIRTHKELGVLCWAWENGDFLTDENNEPMPVSSTPSLDVDDATGCWVVNGVVTDMPAVGGDRHFFYQVNVYYSYTTDPPTPNIVNIVFGRDEYSGSTVSFDVVPAETSGTEYDFMFLKDTEGEEELTELTLRYGHRYAVRYRLSAPQTSDVTVSFVKPDGWKVEYTPDNQNTEGELYITAPAQENPIAEAEGTISAVITAGSSTYVSAISVKATVDAPEGEPAGPVYTFSLKGEDGSAIVSSSSAPLTFAASEPKILTYEAYLPVGAEITFAKPEGWTLTSDNAKQTVTITAPATADGATLEGGVTVTATFNSVTILDAEVIAYVKADLQVVLAPQPGDFYYADGTWSPVLSETVENPAIGVVFWVGTHTDGKLLKDYPALAQGSNHGLVVAFRNVLATTFRSERDVINLPTVSYENSLLANEGNEVGSVLQKGAYGYANTCLLRETNDSKLTILTALDSYAETYACPAPENTSDWFIPSAVEFNYLLTGEALSLGSPTDSWGTAFANFILSGSATNGAAVYDAIDEKCDVSSDEWYGATYNFNGIWLSHIDSNYPNAAWYISGSINGPYSLGVYQYAEKRAVRPILAF
ncbi:MAG TPA: DUF4988 domain-containing protein [Candidatus Coprenecus stercoravium]|uniref:DUF4988 domain-containing protein n=1 Tax=Candidatus Coprenecus stercoravium TaxID=2840735 RepID=A0A9D2GPG7_9BACT|nr:DUF4988 domain-containing protein [Candidatus Coprenecus stercoravium]